jgi:hypothetical protein
MKRLRATSGWRLGLDLDWEPVACPGDEGCEALVVGLV